jgi:site-specific recombinase XerD
VRKASHDFKRLVRRLGYPQLHLHDVRHGFAGLMLAGGTDLRVISEMLGHSSIAVTADIYTAVLPKLQTDAAARLNALIGGEVASL